MTTLHIEHPISDYSLWRTAFDKFAPLRTAAGVETDRVLRPVDDDHYIVIELDFADQAHATAFLDTLRTNIWNLPESSPALAGQPRTIILNPAP
jgi:hypothetical protein